jgi:hypothetical protein
MLLLSNSYMAPSRRLGSGPLRSFISYPIQQRLAI